MCVCGGGTVLGVLFVSKNVHGSMIVVQAVKKHDLMFPSGGRAVCSWPVLSLAEMASTRYFYFFSKSCPLSGSKEITLRLIPD